MRKWKNLSAPDDPGAWFDVSGMWPTRLGTYEVADFYDSGTNKTATGETTSPDTGVSAWCFNTLSGQRCYVVGKKIWEYASGSLTDRTGALAQPSEAFMCQYGDITILARGTGAALASSSGGNFAAIAGAPSARLVVVQSNAVVAFNTSVSADGWAASDVGDYTNWSTGEAASGRILEGSGGVTAAVALGADIIVFKKDAIFRMTYVGGTVKWTIQKVVSGLGCVDVFFSPSIAGAAAACGSAIMFLGQVPGSGVNAEQYFLFDGVSQPRPINTETQLRAETASFIALTVRGAPMFDHESRTVCLIAQEATYGLQPYFYNLDSDAWGRGGLVSGTGTVKTLPVRGDQSAVSALFSIDTPLRPVFIAGVDKFVLYAPVAPGGSTSCSGYVQTAKSGAGPDDITTFSRLIPLLFRRAPNSSGSPAVSLTFNLYNERHRIYSNSGSGAVLAAPTTTRSVTEASQRNRFDLLSGAAANCYADFKITFTDMDAEIEDVLIKAKKTGEV